MSKKNYYEILQVELNSSEELIWKSYTKLHKIITQESKTDKISRAEGFKKIEEITEAYGVLSDPKERRRYNKYDAIGITQYFKPNFNISNKDDFDKIMNEVLERFTQESEEWEKVKKELKEIGEKAEVEKQKLEKKEKV